MRKPRTLAIVDAGVGEKTQGPSTPVGMTI
jgi:hypothetical protein